MKHEALSLPRSRTAGLRLFLVPVAAALLFWPRIFPLDDAYITLSNARTLMSGAPDPAYGTSYLTGATSPVHLLLVALVGLAVPPIWASLLIGLAGAALAVLGLARLVEDAGVRGWRGLALTAAGAASGYTLYHDLNGLETSVAMAASAWLMVWCDDRRRLPLLGGIAPFVRPELALLAALLLGRLWWRTRDWRPIVIAALVAAPFAAWMIAVTGRPLPSTIGAKMAFYREYGFTLMHKLSFAFTSYVDSLQLPLLLGFLGLRKVRAGIAGGLFVAIGIAIAFWLAPGSFNWNDGRYLVIFAPVLIAGIAALVAGRSRGSDLLLAMFCVFAAVCSIASVVNYVQEVTYARRVADQARFVATLPASSVVLIHDAGRVDWEQPKAHLVDVVGLKTPAAIEYHKKLTLAACAWGPALDKIARDTGANYIVVINRWNWPCIPGNLRSQGWTLRPVYSDLYTVYRLSPPAHSPPSHP